MTTLEDVLGQAKAEVAAASTLVALDQVRVQYLGKKGLITEQMKALGQLDPEARKTAGARINEVRDQLTRSWTAGRANVGP